MHENAWLRVNRVGGMLKKTWQVHRMGRGYVRKNIASAHNAYTKLGVATWDECYS